MRRKFLMTMTALAASAVAPARSAFGQSFPTRPIKLVVPFPAGSATDNVARLLAKEMQEDLGQSVIIENRPGAQGVVGAEVVARSPADGYSLLVAAVSFAATPSMFKNPAFDPLKDFTAISRLVTTPLVLMLRSDFPANNLAEFLQYVKARPGKLNAGYGSSSSQVCIAHLASLGDLDVLSVPYKGIPLAVNDLLGGSVDFSFVDLGNAIAQAQGGRLRAIGVTSATRTPLMPDWPALAETLPGFDIDAWVGMFGPSGLPDPIARRLHEVLARKLARAEVQESLAAQGFAAAALDPAQTQAFLKSEVDKWSRLSKQAGIEPQ